MQNMFYIGQDTGRPKTLVRGIGTLILASMRPNWKLCEP